MSSKQHTNTSKSSDDFFRLKPLVAGIKVVIAGGLFVGSSMTQVSAEPLPVPIITGPTITDGSAAHGVASLAINGQQATITQTTNQAIIDWKSFDIAKGYGVNFVQPSASAAALNNIHDANATQILGTLTANGQVYLVNNNGFVFGNDSVVDANAIVASALNISDEHFNGGIIRTFDNNPTTPTAALSGGAATNAAIEVAAGATIHVGPKGKVILAAPTVTNSGSISAEQNSQILLVASQDKVYLQPASSSSPFAGLLVEVGTGGTVNNKAGANVAVREGNITLAGFAVNQTGRLSATTSVNTNGSIRLLAREKAIADVGSKALSASQTVRDEGKITEQAATVIIGTTSLTTILADAKGGSAIDEQEQKQSYVEVSADKIAMQSGSAIVATSAAVTLQATNNLQDPVKIGNHGRIDLEQGSLIDVSGSTNTKVAMTRNLQAVSVQSFNLRNAPYQRGGLLQGTTVQVDVRNLPTIVDASSAPASITRSIDERLSAGGTINLVSGGDVIVNNGAVTKIAGGSVSYLGGFMNTTQLVNATTGQVVDISKADPNQQYSSIYGVYTQNYAKWGVKETWNIMTPLNSGHYEAGYTEGAAAGALNIQSPVIAWAGSVKAGSVSDLYQRSTPAFGGSFTINEADNVGNFAGVFLSSQELVFQKAQLAVKALGINDSLDSTAPIILSTDLFNGSGLSNIVIKTSGTVTVLKDANLTLPMLSNLSIEASAFKVQGSIYTPGGTIGLNAISTADASSGQLNLLADAQLNVSGRWVNDFKEGISTPLAINAGKVKLSAAQISMDQGAVIKADGGAQLNVAGNSVIAGKAGGITLSADNLLFKGATQTQPALSAIGLTQGGSLSLSTNKIVIGNQVTDPSALNLGVSHGELELTTNAGFKSLSLTSTLEDITIVANTNLSFMDKNRLLNTNFREQAGAQSLADLSQLTTLPENSRAAYSLSLTGLTGVTLETGSQLHLEKNSKVTLNTDNLGSGIYINGLIDTPAGEINLNLLGTGAKYNPAQAIWLGSQASLNVQGSTVLDPIDALGRQTGSVLNGGAIKVAANRGYVVFEQGSSINVDGASASLNIPVLNSLQTTAQVIGSNAGQITIRAAEGIVLDGSLSAQKGLASNSGGSLNLLLDRSYRLEPPKDLINPETTFFPANALHIDVQQQATPLLPKSLVFGAMIPESLNGQAVVSSHKIQQAGIDNLSLTVPYGLDPQTSLARAPGEVRLLGDVKLDIAASIILDAQHITGINNNSASHAATINTGYLTLGSSTFDPIDVSEEPVIHNGSLTANANYIQLQGSSVLTGFSAVSLNSQHDMRTVGVNVDATTKSYIGSLTTAANLSLQASQLYPATLTHFSFTVTEPSSQLTISGQNTDATPLSAAGSLNFNAPTINQNGVIKAPLGNIAFKATDSLFFNEGSVTSVSAEGLTIPFGTVLNNVWQYPIGGAGDNLIYNVAPEHNVLGIKQLSFDAANIQFNKGSVLNISGGGDLTSATFQPGPGGQYDYLMPGSPTYKGGFAIMPSLGVASLSPFDPFLATTFGYEARAQVYLSGTEQLAAGFYTMLPTYYALLPGAFLVTLQNTSRVQTMTTYTASGLPIVSGYETLAGTAIKPSLNSSYLIESSAQVQKNSQYITQSANTFFTQQAADKATSVPFLPEDSGQISINASTQLLLEGQFKVAAPHGRGAKLDISANNIDVVNAINSSNTTAGLQLLAQDLNNLQVDSLLLGGIRTVDLAGKPILKVLADTVTFNEGVNLQTLDLMAVGKQRVNVMSGATINAAGSVNTGATVINLTGDSAFLRVSADKQVQLNRNYASDEATLGAGDLNIEAGANLKSTQSMFLAASGSSKLDGSINMSGGSISLQATAINVGDVAQLPAGALNLTNQNLTKLMGNNVTLTSLNGINFYGDVGQVDANNGLVPIQFNHLVLDASSLSGYGNHGNSAMLQANTIALQNSSGNTATQAGTGTGSLSLSATQFKVNKGVISLDGFSTANINADKQFSATDNSVLNAATDLNLTAGLFNTTGGHSLLIDASSGAGHKVNISGNASNILPLAKELGGSLAVIANNIILQDAKVLMPSGSLTLTALAGDVRVNGTTQINLAGQADNFADVVSYTLGGSFSASANNGIVSLGSNTALDISSGAVTATGGSLSLEAPQGTVDLAGSLKTTGANARLDVSSFLPAQGFDSLMNKFMAAGVNQALYVRSRVSDIVQSAGNIITAKTISLVADSGSIAIKGQLHTDSSAQAGNIKLYAAHDISLEKDSLLSATGAIGGNVLLSALGTSAVPGGTISLLSGSTIDVTGSSGAGGTVTLDALRNNNATGINIAPIAGKVTGTVSHAIDGDVNNFYAVGFKKYDGSRFNNNIFKLEPTITSDIKSYMANASSKAGLLGAGISLRPGVEIDNATGAMRLVTAWDFSSLSAGTTPIVGDFIVRAAGQLNLFASLTDGYTNNKLMNTDSWSFQLVSGADLSSADTMATNSLRAADRLNDPTMNDLTIGVVLTPKKIYQNVSIHTGTGNIDLASGGNVVITDQTDTVYTGGRSTLTNPKGTLDGLHEGTGLLAKFDNDKKPVNLTAFVGDYPIDGGTVVIQAAGDIAGAVSKQFIRSTNDIQKLPWLAVQGHPYDKDNNNNNKLTTWAVNPNGIIIDIKGDVIKDANGVPVNLFQENIGSFGGGAVTVSALGDINDLSVMMPTTAKQLGTDYANSALDIQGGGQMTVAAGGNVSGGAYFLGQGAGTISAGAQIIGSQSTKAHAFVSGPQLVMSGNQGDPLAGNSSLSLNANQGIHITGVSDVMVLQDKDKGTQFFSYTDNSQLTLSALAGDIHLNSDTNELESILGINQTLKNDGSGQAWLAHVYPASLVATAFNGSVVLDHDVILFPSAVANVNVLAKQGIASGMKSSTDENGDPIQVQGNFSLTMSDADTALLSNAFNTINGDLDPSYFMFNTDILNAQANVIPRQLSSSMHSTTKPLHIADKSSARFVTQVGDISSVAINIPKQTIVQAGNDLVNSSILIQQNNASNASIISAGRDIKFVTELDSNGNPTLANDNKQIQVAGPGNVLLKSVRNIDLGASVGLTSIGNLFNPALASTGANLDILVGLQGGIPDYVTFIDKYLITNPLYANEYAKLTHLITPFMQQESGNPALTDAQALTAFAALTPTQTLTIQSQLNAIITPVFFNELQLAGTASAADKTKGNAGGFAAIAALFPSNQWQGDLTMPFSKLQTVKGGGINIFVPGGKVDAGLAIAPSGAGAKTADKLGIVAQAQGAIKAYVKNDFTVNTSRVFTLGGGDIEIWSSEGNIDAGKGAKGALSVTVDPPYFDVSGNLVIPVPKITSGSGIRAASAPGQEAGNVSLFAPGGIVDAGEAGIGGNNVTISATAVMGGNNIQVGGTSTGVPQASSGSMAAGLTGASNLTANVSQVGQALAGVDDKESQNSKNNTLSMLSVEVLGFGD